MFYISISKDNNYKLVHFCHNCGNTDEYDNEVETICVVNSDNATTSVNDNSFINKYTKFDPTLPRLNNIPCPNKDCESNITKGFNNEIIYVRIDDINMKYVYICNTCDTNWNTIK
jgi:DNA-directed RNA polymerase subunit M/transcription elongation factor TFIIS